MNIHFYLRFSTVFGQRLELSGDMPSLGMMDEKHAVSMTWVDKDHWSYELKLDEKGKSFPKQLRYKYQLRNKDNEIVEEWGEDKVIDLEKITAEDVHMIDTWNHAGEYENTFYTSPFQEVLLPKPRKNGRVKPYRGNTHIFKVKAPLLSPGQCLFILGGTKPLMNWAKESPILMTLEGNWWTVKVNLSNEKHPIAYKYGVYDLRKKELVVFEGGDNRMLYDGQVQKQVTILHDGFVRLSNTSWKGAGVAVPVFSLRTARSFGVGEFSDLKLLSDWAAATGLKLIQILPVNDTTSTHTWEDSYPYKAISAFAMHPLYLDLDKVAGKEHASILKPYRKKQKALNALPEVDYEGVMNLKWQIIRELYAVLKQHVFESEEYKAFLKKNRHWLVAYAAFSYLRDKYKTADFSKWSTHSKYDAKSIDRLAAHTQKHFDEIGLHYFIQFHLHLQLEEASQYAHKKKVVLKGDIPIGVNRHGADAWMDPELYEMDLQAGAPPDDFAVKGQNWGFPIYNWKKMAEDGFSWWRKRFEQMSNYFNAFRIDHILGFFRIWSIPVQSVEGIMGHFVPALPVHEMEFAQRGIAFNRSRYTEPFITEGILKQLFGESTALIIPFLHPSHNGNYSLQPGLQTQAEVEARFKGTHPGSNSDFVRQGLNDLISNIILFAADGKDGHYYHFRISMEDTPSFKWLDEETKSKVRDLYVNYFFRRQDEFWEKEAMHKLPFLKRATNMLICGEDLGMVPHSVPDVMRQLGILSLEIQRMPKDPLKEFFHPADAPYLSVVTPSTHDMSTIRGWWEESPATTQHFYNSQMGQQGPAPFYCEPWINKFIVNQHLHSPAMWSIFLVQDLLGMDATLRREFPQQERINVPANAKHYWRYRMHISLEQLLKEKNFNEELKQSVILTGRA